MFTPLRQVIGFLAVTSLITGLAYPLGITAVSQLLFPQQANGSLIQRDGVTIGSSLIAQNFTGAGYFHPRPSAAGKDGYDAGSSGGSNLGVATRALNDTIAQRVHGVQRDGAPVPADLVMASGSGLDPQLSPQAALYQAPSVAAARVLPLAAVQALVNRHVEPRQFGVLGEPRVNVLQLNLALDQLAANPVGAKH